MPDFCAGDDILTATNGQTRYFPYKSMLYNEENASQTYYGLWDATTSSPSGRTNYDMYKGIRYCYIMIDNIDAVPGISPSVADEFKDVYNRQAFNYDTKSWTYRKYAYPYIRLAELYLSYAEADFEYNGSLSDASLNYLNLVRRRSGPVSYTHLPP